VGIRCADHVTPSTRKFGTNFADKRRSLGIFRYLTSLDSWIVLLKRIGSLSPFISLFLLKGIITALFGLIDRFGKHVGFRVEDESSMHSP
jgi:hypothetical protein